MSRSAALLYRCKPKVFLFAARQIIGNFHSFRACGVGFTCACDAI
nr:MAG TPA: hypothetical protein [Caudoviricetes sp.]